jgi:hypothetical protein
MIASASLQHSVIDAKQQNIGSVGASGKIRSCEVTFDRFPWSSLWLALVPVLSFL